MLWMIARRLRDIVLMLLMVNLLTLVMLGAVPGGYCYYVLPETAPPRVLEACLKHEPPLLEKYVRTLDNLAHLSLGYSRHSGRPVAEELGEQIPSTVVLALVSLALSLSIGLSAGLLAAHGRKSWWGLLLNWAGVSLLSVPSFVVALLLLQLLAMQFKWLRILGNPNEWQGLIMPVLAIALPLSALFMRVTRNAVIDVQDREYIRTAQAKGLRPSLVLFRHALPNALAAIIPLTGLVLAGLLDGTLLIEKIFARPGLGSYTFDALLSHNYPALQGVVLLVTITTTTANLAADLLQAYLLPPSREELLSR